MFQFSLNIVWSLPLHRLQLSGSLVLRSVQPLLVRLAGSESLSSLTAGLQQSIQLRFGGNDSAGGVLRHWLSSSLPTGTTAAIVHRAANRGGRGHCGDTSHGNTTRTAAVAIAADGAGGLGQGRIGCDDRCSSGVGCRQRWADVMVMLGGTWRPTIHDLIVALLALR